MEEIVELDKSLQPMSLVLVKVNSASLIQSSNNKFTFDSFHHTSSINSPSPSRIPQQLSFCSGSPSSSDMQR